jgi:hypothetical protein
VAASRKYRSFADDLANGYANAVTTPVGEVALSILAEMIAVRGEPQRPTD